MKQYHTYIFDLDGTITDTSTLWLDIFRDCLVYYGVRPPDDRTLALHTHDWKQMLELGLPEEKLQEFIKHAYALANEKLPSAPLHTGAYEMLETLKNNSKRVSFYSGMDRVIFEPAMKRHNLFALSEVSIAGTDIPRRKPHPDGILKVLDDMGISKDEYKHVVYIGDKDTDIVAAHNAGVDAILYYPAAHQLIYSLNELKKHKPEYVISDWKELIA